MIVAFLAVLELVRLQAVVLIQQHLFSEILLRKHRMFNVVFEGGDPASHPMKTIDEQYS
jgi:chromatin segregation and condensation protein Rec8/ScpA/Scc1 (kleisin family)